jgi:hypothetical protein
MLASQHALLPRIGTLLFFTFLKPLLGSSKFYDLSHQPHLHPKSIVDWCIQEIKSDNSDFVNVDISGTLSGDVSALKDIVLCMKTSFGLTAQLNSLPNGGVADLFQNLIQLYNRTETNQSVEFPRIRFLDLGWNFLGSEENHDHVKFNQALRNLIQSRACCPEILRLEFTGISASTCRAIAKGIIERYQTSQLDDDSPISLYLSGNKGIGDAGAAALAAALRSIPDTVETVLHTLDLSSCDISDAGCDTLALALESNHNCVRELILCHNKISDQGSLTMGRTFRGHLDLSNNEITDRGISSIASALECGQLSYVSLRSCLIHADGAEKFGRALRSFALEKNVASSHLEIDLSGNPLGILRGKGKSNDSKYSASRLKSKASATAAAYVNQGLTFFKRSLGPSTIESDDEEEKKDATEKVDERSDSESRCGFKAMASAFIGENRRASSNVKLPEPRSIKLGLRRTFCDTAGAEALAAMILAARELGVDVKLDVSLNPVVDPGMLAALCGNDDFLLRDMAERYNHSMEIIRRAQARAAHASRMAAARLEEEDEFGEIWNEENSFDKGDQSDSDADYSDSY